MDYDIMSMPKLVSGSIACVYSTTILSDSQKNLVKLIVNYQQLSLWLRAVAQGANREDYPTLTYLVLTNVECIFLLEEPRTCLISYGVKNLYPFVIIAVQSQVRKLVINKHYIKYLIK